MLRMQKKYDVKHVSYFHFLFCSQISANTHLLLTVKNCYDLWKKQPPYEFLENYDYENVFSNMNISEPGTIMHHVFAAWCICDRCTISPFLLFVLLYNHNKN